MGMTEREKVIKELHDARRYLEDKEWSDRGASPHIDAIDDALALLKEQEVMSPDEFKNGLLKMFSSIWDCEVDHPVFQDTVGELMSAVMQLYARAVKRE